MPGHAGLRNGRYIGELNIMKRIQLHVLRPLIFGKSWAAGETIGASPLEANQLLSGGRVQLMNPGDLDTVNEAQQIYNRRVCALEAAR